jgi:hypothetical protein
MSLGILGHSSSSGQDSVWNAHKTWQRRISIFFVEVSVVKLLAVAVASHPVDIVVVLPVVAVRVLEY